MNPAQIVTGCFVLDKSSFSDTKDKAMKLLGELKTAAENTGAKVQVDIVEFNRTGHDHGSYDLATQYEAIEEAFANCPHLASVILPKSLYRLGKDVFSGDDLIEEFVIPSRVESIGTGSFNCKCLKRIIVEPHNPSYIAVDNVLFSRNGSALVKFANDNAITDYTIPNGVAKIVEEAFYGCKSLAKVNISSNVNIIGDKAFMNCDKIEAIDIPSSVEKIGNEAFCNCSSLLRVKMSNGTTNIGNRVFYACTKLNEVNIPTSLLKIGDEAFAGCSALKAFVLPSYVEYVGKNIFEGTITSK